MSEMNQEAKADAGKPRLTLVPMQFVWDAAEVREFGTMKYKDPENWTRVEIQRYREALLRHVLAYIDDPDAHDDESGLYALSHVACNVAFLCALEHDRRKDTGQKNMESIPVSVTPALVEDPIEPETAADVKPEAPPEPLKKPRQRIDRGAVKALRAKGWTIKEIANDPLVQCSEQTVRNILNDKE